MGGENKLPQAALWFSHTGSAAPVNMRVRTHIIRVYESSSAVELVSPKSRSVTLILSAGVWVCRSEEN